MNTITILCQDKYEAEKLTNLIFVNDTKETYVVEILDVIENEIVLSIKDKSAHSVILRDNGQVLLFLDFIQSVLEKKQKIVQTETVKKKINKYAFSGGQPDIEEHRKKGGNPDIDVSYQYLRIFFEPDDKKLKQIHDDYKSGKMLTGELKQILIEKINKFLASHQQKREKARDQLDKFLLKD